MRAVGEVCEENTILGLLRISRSSPECYRYEGLQRYSGELTVLRMLVAPYAWNTRRSLSATHVHCWFPMGIRLSAWDHRKGFAGHDDSKKPFVFGPYKVCSPHEHLQQRFSEYICH